MKMMNLLSWKWINEEREIPGRQKVVRGPSVSTLTSHAGLNPHSKHYTQPYGFACQPL